MARKRFNRGIIASSDPYKKHSHDLYIKECHENNKEILIEITTNIRVSKKYYIKCFGNLIPITEIEAATLSSKYVIIK